MIRNIPETRNPKVPNCITHDYNNINFFTSSIACDYMTFHPYFKNSIYIEGYLVMHVHRTMI